MTSPAPSPALIPSEIDKYAAEYLELKHQVLQAKLEVRDLEEKMELKAEIVKSYAASFGSSHAEKSKIVHGLKYEAVVTFGQTVSIDAAAVENFRLALVKEDKPRLLKKLFDKTIRWTLNPQASEFVRGEKLSDRLRSLFAKCQVVKERTPTLTVRMKQA